MVAYVLTGNATFRDIGNASIWGVATARAGGDTVDVAGFKLTIDQDRNPLAIFNLTGLDC